MTPSGWSTVASSMRNSRRALPLTFIKRRKLLFIDLFFSPGTEVMDQHHQHLNQRIGQLLAATPTEHSDHAVTDR